MHLHHSPTPNPTHAYPHLLVCFSVIQPQTTNNRTHHSCHHQCQANSPSVHFFSLSTNIYMVLINNCFHSESSSDLLAVISANKHSYDSHSCWVQETVQRYKRNQMSEHTKHLQNKYHLCKCTVKKRKIRSKKLTS